MKHLLAGLVALLLLSNLCAGQRRPAIAANALGNEAEQILQYDSRVQVNPDCSLLVRETISVNARHQKIKHGIYRDFPTSYPGPWGLKRVVGFQVEAVTIDGHPGHYNVEPHHSGVRIRMGNPNALVSMGRHVYDLVYRTDRQLGFFPDHDELYWNVTGNGWDFPIKQASATVLLPRAPGPHVCWAIPVRLARSCRISASGLPTTAAVALSPPSRWHLTKG